MIKAPSGLTSIKRVQLSEEGYFDLWLKLEEEGVWSFKASWSGDEKYLGSSSQLFSVTCRPKRCLIATAAFGTELAEPVRELRAFRDEVVAKTYLGSCFLKTFNYWYYSWAPYVAAAELACEPLRQAVKYAIYPLMWILQASKSAYCLFSFIPEGGVLASGIVASALIGLTYLTPPMLASTLLFNGLLTRLLRKLRIIAGLYGVVFSVLLLSIPIRVECLTGPLTLLLSFLTVLIAALTTSTLILFTWKRLRT